jgi:KDO2-lipid IV(A) lauroyltransferase
MARRTELMRDLQWRFEAALWDLLSAILRIAPIDAASNFGGWLVRQLGPLTSTHRTALRNLRLAFPEWDEAERRRVARAQWENVGRALFEIFMVDRIVADRNRIEVVNLERLAEMKESRQPVVFVSGHFANWEIMAAAMSANNVEALFAYRAANNPYIDTRIIESRRRYGANLMAPKGLDGGREVMAALSRGMSVAILNDQRYDEGVLAPFFGHMAQTQHAAVRFAMRFGARLQPGCVQRVKGARFRVIIHEPIELERTGSKTADVEAGVRRINEYIEARVRERPAEWWWVHRRFPKELYAQLAAQGY